MLISKTAVGSLLGFGVSYDFTLDSGITSQVMSIELFSKLQSGTYTDGELGVFLYDKTNAAFIPLSMQNITATTSGSNRFYASFFPSTSTSYRLIFHNTIANTTTSWAVQVDRIIVAPQTTPNAAAIGAWISYTSVGNITNLPGSWAASSYRRVGNSLEFQGRYVASGVATGGLGLTLASILPSGLTASSIIAQYPIVATKNNVTNWLGVWDGSNFYGPNGQTGWNATVPFTWASGDYINMSFSVPIAQWTANINLATDFTEYASNDGSGGVAANTTYNTGMVSGPSGSLFVIPVSGVGSNQETRYKVIFSRPIQATDALVVEIWSTISNSWQPIFTSRDVQPLTYQGTGTYGLGITPIDSTSVYAVFGNGGRVSSGATYGVAGANWGITTYRWRVRKVSNGNMAEVPPVVRARYATAAGQVLTATLANINFGTKEEDTHNAVTPGASWKFTAPVAGVYQFNGMLLTANRLFSQGTYSELTMNKNGSSPFQLSRPIAWSAITTYAESKFSGIIRLAQGDYIAVTGVRGAQADYALHTDATYNWIDITRIGS
jgi:hypothetical protein